MHNTIFCLVDIDDFSLFNLKKGFANGNETMKRLENLIERIASLVSWKRLGGDEFVFSCNGSFAENKQMLFGLLKESENDLGITISIGVVESNSSSDAEFLLSSARSNVIRAKSAGKNKICLT